jgi:hypothetical protein
MRCGGLKRNERTGWIASEFVLTAEFFSVVFSM